MSHQLALDCSTGLHDQFSDRDYSRVRCPCRLDRYGRRWSRSIADSLPAPRPRLVSLLSPPCPVSGLPDGACLSGADWAALLVPTTASEEF